MIFHHTMTGVFLCDHFKINTDILGKNKWKMPLLVHFLFTKLIRAPYSRTVYVLLQFQRVRVRVGVRVRVRVSSLETGSVGF